MKEEKIVMQILAVLGMGFTSVLVQIIALRQLLTVFSGNELDIGITLAVWLFTVGIGSYAGHRIRSRHAFGASFLVVALLIQATVLFISLIHMVFGLVAGETVPLTTTMVSTVLSLLPICLVIGAQFPLSVACLKGDSSKTFGLEATGAFVGGALFTFVLSGSVSAFFLSTAISALNILIALMLLKKTRLIALLIIPLSMHYGSERIIDHFAEQGAPLVQRVESRYGTIMVYGSQDQLNVYSSGKFEFSYPDTQTEELKAHVPMSLHDAPARVLLIGGSPAVIREFLKYPLASIDFVEIDPALIDVSFGILSKKDREQIDDARLKIHARDARQFVKSASSQYDLVVLNLPEPATANLNRFYTVEFFREIRSSMNKTGVFSLTVPASHGYIGSRMQAANGSIYRSLKTVFANIALSSEEYGGMYASDSPLENNADMLIRRFSERAIPVTFFSPFLFKDIFDPLKTSMVMTRLEKVDTLNRDKRPVAYLYNLMLWADMSGGKGMSRILGLGDRGILPFFIAALLIAVASLWKKRRAVYYSLFTTGYATMAFTMIILLAYQASYGYVYERIGFLTAVFMAGSAAGAYGARKLKSYLRCLQLIEMACLLLFIVAPLFFRLEFLYFALTFLCGIIGGAQFVITNSYAEGGKRGAFAGRLYALDLGGSVLGALLTALFVVPLLGIGNALLWLILLKSSSLLLLFTVEKRYPVT